MATTHQLILEDFGYVDIKEIVTDPTAVWSLADTLFGLAFVLAFYFLAVLIILPDLMSNRAPFKLNTLLRYYNGFQVIYSVYLVFIYARYMFRHGVITKRCPQGKELEEVIAEIYPYFIAKHLDLLDTVFFVLRKKVNQTSFLHLYHHAAMVSWTWLHYMYHPTDHFVVVGLLNSFVHVLMYAYYGIAAMGPGYAKYVWWKKHLTKVQLVQFILVVSHLYYQQKLTSCPIPEFFHYFCVGCISSFFILFMKFYFSSYKMKRENVKEKNNE